MQKLHMGEVYRRIYGYGDVRAEKTVNFEYGYPHCRCQIVEILARINNVKCTNSRECHMFHNTRWIPAVNNLKT